MLFLFRLAQIAAIALVLGLASPALGGTPDRVAVVVAARVNVDLSTALDIGDRLGTALEKKLVVEAIDSRESARQLPGETGEVSPTCVADRQCLQDLVSRLRATEILLVSLTKVGPTLRIEIARFRAGADKARSLRPIRIDSGTGTLEFEAAAPTLVPSAPLRPAPEKPSNRRRTTTWILAGTSVLSLALAGGLGIATWLEHSDLDDRCRDSICSDSAFDSLETRRLTADIFLGLGLASGVAAGILWLSRADEEHDPALSGGPGDIGLSWMTRF